MKNYWIEKVKTNKSGKSWVIRVKNKKTGKQTQKSFKKSEFTKGEVKEIRKQIIANDTHRNQDTHEYDPFNYISLDYNFKMDRAAELFIQDCKQKDLADTTIRFRESILDKFTETQSGLVNNIQEKDIKDFVNSSCNTMNSKNQYGSVFRQLFSFLQDEYGIKPKFQVPRFGTKRQRKKENSKNPTILSEQEFWKLYKQGLNRYPKNGTPKHFIDLQCLPLYFYTGMRKEELPHIKIRDIDLGSEIPTMDVGKNKLTKSYKERKIWIPEKAHKHLKVLMKDKAPDEYLVDHKRSNSADSIMRSTSYVFDICYQNTYPRREKMSLHNLRHSCGCWLLEQGFSMMFVKDQLGHTKLDRTLIYARMTARGFINEVNKFKQSRVT